MLKEIANTLKQLKPHMKSQISFRIVENGTINSIIEVYSNDGQLYKEEMQMTLESLEYAKIESNAIEAMLNRINSKL